MFDSVADGWVATRGAPLEQQVVGLRLVLACLSAWSYQYPLTEERHMELIRVGGGRGRDALRAYARVRACVRVRVGRGKGCISRPGGFSV